MIIGMVPSSSQEKDTNSANGIAIVPIATEMVTEIAGVHSQAYPGEMHTRLGRAYVKAFLGWFRQTNNGIALAAIDENGKPIGYVVGAPVGYARSMNRDLLLVGSAAMVLRPWLFFETQFREKVKGRLRLTFGSPVVKHVEPDLPELTMSLVSIAVLPSVRRHKIGQRLIEAFELRSRKLKMSAVRLSVYPKNIVARLFYERCCWQSFSGPVRDTGEMYYYRVLDSSMDFNCPSIEV